MTPIPSTKLFGIPEILLLLVGVFGLILIFVVDFDQPNWLAAISIGFMLSLPVMLAGWCSIRSGLWRYVLAVLFALLNGWILSLSSSHGHFDLMISLLPLGTILPTLSTLFVVKRLLGRFAPLDSGEQLFREGLRFSLTHLFIVTTALAILIAIGKALVDADFLRFSAVTNQYIGIGSLALLLSFNTVMSVWALMGQAAFLRLCIAVPVAIVSSVVCCQVCAPETFFEIWLILAGVPIVSTFLLVAVFRLAGWRFWKVTT